MENNEYKNTEIEERKSELNAYKTGRRNETGLEPVFSSSDMEREYQAKGNGVSVNNEASSVDTQQGDVYSGYNNGSTGYPGYGNYQNRGNEASQYQTYNNQNYTPRNTVSTGYESQTYGAYQMHNVPQRPAAGYQNYPQPVKAKQPKKRSGGSGRGAAVIAAAMIISLLAGAGGGFFGAYVMTNNNTSSGSVSTQSTVENDNKKSEKSTSENSKTDEESDSVKITEASETKTTPTTIQEVAAMVKDSVVEITTETTSYDSFYGSYVSKAAGSGVIISEDGYIITNNHVIEDANTITVRLTNSKTYTAKLIGKDATLDVALLKIDETGLTTAKFGNSAKLSVGQIAIAIGNPLGQLGGTVTDGIISATDREIQLDGKTMNLLQTNAAINPGNSGGGLFDSNGNLIGIVVAKSTTTSSGTSVEGLGFAIPINDVSDVLDDLKKNGKVTNRAYLGVNLREISSEDDMFTYRVDKAGVYITAVTAGSAAEKAGLQIGDCIEKFDGKEVESASSLTAMVSKHKSGDTVELTIYRDGKEQTLSVTLGEKTTDSSSSEKRRTYDDDDYIPRW